VTDLSAAPKPAVVTVGERFGITLRYTAAEIAAFALASHDHNPLHHDAAFAARSSVGGIIASGPHTTSIMMGLTASHFSRCDDGVRREMLGMNFNFAFKAPIHPGEDIRIEWHVSAARPHARLGGWVVQLEGTASTQRAGPALVGRGTLLVKEL
jgi:acyl dehydratase